MSNTTAIISIDGVTKRFGPVVAVDRVSLEIQSNEFFALLGPSGCGKTTLLRMLAGFETPDEGAFLIDGQDVTDVAPNRRPVNMVFQSYAVFPHMTVFENVAYGLKVVRTAASEIDARVREALDMTQLGGLAERPRTSSPVASASAWRSPAPWSSDPRCCCSTSRCRRSTPSCARPCGWSWSTCSMTWGSLSSS